MPPFPPPDPNPVDKVELLLRERLKDLVRALTALAAAKAMRELGKPGAAGAEAVAAETVRALIVDLLAASDLLGRVTVLDAVQRAAVEAGTISPRQAQRVTKILQGRGPLKIPSTVPSSVPLPGGTAGVPSPPGIVAPVPPTPAIEAIVKRVPALAADGDEVARLYNESDIVFSAARLVDEAVGQRVKVEITRMIEAGVRPAEAAEVIQGLTGWTRSYAETVFVTNAATMFTQGVIAETLSEGVRDVMLAWETIGPDDALTRRGRPQDHGEHHKAGIGLVAGVNDDVWGRAMPPWGYNCRHTIRAVSVFELERRGLLGPGEQVIRYEPPDFASFAPHPRFVGTGLL